MTKYVYSAPRREKKKKRERERERERAKKRERGTDGLKARVHLSAVPKKPLLQIEDENLIYRKNISSTGWLGLSDGSFRQCTKGALEKIGG